MDKNINEEKSNLKVQKNINQVKSNLKVQKDINQEVSFSLDAFKKKPEVQALIKKELPQKVPAFIKLQQELGTITAKDIKKSTTLHKALENCYSSIAQHLENNGQSSNNQPKSTEHLEPPNDEFEHELHNLELSSKRTTKIIHESTPNVTKYVRKTLKLEQTNMTKIMKKNI